MDESLAARPGRGAGTENEDMDDLTRQDALELEVANFGPIVEAKIDLRPRSTALTPVGWVLNFFRNSPASIKGRFRSPLASGFTS